MRGQGEISHCSICKRNCPGVDGKIGEKSRDKRRRVPSGKRISCRKMVPLLSAIFLAPMNRLRSMMFSQWMTLPRFISQTM
jgi:hypothetical protein